MSGDKGSICLKARFKKACAQALVGMAAGIGLMAVIGGAQASHNELPELRESGTAYSDYVRGLQKRFRESATGTRIVYIDHDWIHLNAALRQLAPGNDRERAELLASYIESRTGLPVNPARMERLVPNIVGNRQTAMMIDDAQDDEIPMAEKIPDRICIVLGHREGVSARSQIEEMTGLTPQTLSMLGARHETKVDPQTQNRMTDYHEIGHCMDRWYWPVLKSLEVGDARVPALWHKAEAFAEVYGLLTLAAEGITDYGPARADQRLAGIVYSGLHEQRLSEEGTTLGAYVYALHGPLRAAQKRIEDGEAGAKLTPERVAALAHEIVERHAMEPQSTSHAILYSLKTNFRLTDWDSLHLRFPHIKPAYEQALSLRSEISGAFGRLLGGNIPDLENMPLKVYDSALLALAPTSVPPDQNERSIASLKARLLERAGGPSASETSLIDAAESFKDEARSVMAHHPELRHEQAMEDLRVIPAAMHLAIAEIRAQRLPGPAVP